MGCTEFSDWFPNDHTQDPRAQDVNPPWAISSPAYRSLACLEPGCAPSDADHIPGCGDDL